MNKTKRKQTEYNKLVGRIDDSFYFCDYIFFDTLSNKPFKGATGTVLEPVSRSYYEDTQDPDNEDTKDRVKDIWQMAVNDDKTEQSLKEYVEDIINYDGDEFFFDLSGYDLHDQIREAEPEYNEEDFPIFNCIGGGRCFDVNMKFDKIYDKELWKKIKAVESED